VGTIHYFESIRPEVCILVLLCELFFCIIMFSNIYYTHTHTDTYIFLVLHDRLSCMWQYTFIPKQV